MWCAHKDKGTDGKSEDINLLRKGCTYKVHWDQATTKQWVIKLHFVNIMSVTHVAIVAYNGIKWF